MYSAIPPAGWFLVFTNLGLPLFVVAWYGYGSFSTKAPSNKLTEREKEQIMMEQFMKMLLDKKGTVELWWAMLMMEHTAMLTMIQLSCQGY